jgi:hypothetical protein
MRPGANCTLHYPYDHRGPKLDHGDFAVDVCLESMCLPFELLRNPEVKRAPRDQASIYQDLCGIS